MKKYIFFISLLLVSLSSCRKDNGVNLGNPDDRILDSNNSSSSSNSNSSNNNVGVVVNGFTIPAATITWMAARYSGYRIHEVALEIEHGVTYYKVRLRNGNADVRLLFTKDWVFVGLK